MHIVLTTLHDNLEIPAKKKQLGFLFLFNFIPPTFTFFDCKINVTEVYPVNT
ncbi:hypothetical protein Q0N88_20935 [Bacillus thuringiensis]